MSWQLSRRPPTKLAPLLAVGDDVDAHPALGLHGEAGCVLGRRVELRVGEPPFHVRVDGLAHPSRARPASHSHDRGPAVRRRSRAGVSEGIAPAAARSML